MIQRFGDAPRRDEMYRRRPGVYAILHRAGRILLTYQGDPHFEVQLPGGGIDPGESPIHALHREVMEETGWTIAAPRRLGAFRRFTFMPEYELWAEKICTIYLARPARCIGPPTEPDHAPLWSRAADAAPLLYNEGDAAFVRRVLART